MRERFLKSCGMNPWLVNLMEFVGCFKIIKLIREVFSRRDAFGKSDWYNAGFFPCVLWE